MSEFSEKFRKLCTEGDRKRDEGLKTPEDIERFDDIVYGTVEKKWQMLDVYRPKSEKGKKLPVILSIHGGGWVYGDKDVYQYYCMNLAQRGFAVVNFSYRLAPEYKYPASFEDISSVAGWILENAEEYGFDTAHIFGVGDSAGGHMLSLYAAALSNPVYQPQYKTAKGFRFTAIALNCGHYETKKEDYEKEGALNPMADLLPLGGTEEELQEVNVVAHVGENYPPSFVMTCPGDFLYAAPEALIAQFKKNGVPFVYRVYGCKSEPLQHVFHCNIRSSFAKLCNDEECAFFKEFL